MSGHFALHRQSTVITGDQERVQRFQNARDGSFPPDIADRLQKVFQAFQIRGIKSIIGIELHPSVQINRLPNICKIFPGSRLVAESSRYWIAVQTRSQPVP